MKSKPPPRPARRPPTAESVAGEEDPGAALDTTPGASDGAAPPDPSRRSSGDEADSGTPGTGKDVCLRCGGGGRVGDAPCPTCGGTGKMIRGIGGG